MKVQNCSSENNLLAQQEAQNNKKSPNFKAGVSDAMFNLAGGIMNGVQSSGFVASFLIQDGLGMTAPRVGTGFMRDKEVTGEYNFQEGKEVLLREALTGPIMMAMAPICLLLAAKFGRSTSVNSQLIKRFGDSFKTFIAKPDFDKGLLKNKDVLKKEYFRNNIESMLENTVGKDNFNNSDIEFILEHIKNYENPPAKPDVKGLFKKKNYRKQCLAKIESRINSLKYNSSSELELLDNVKVSSASNKAKAYNTKDTIEAMIKYGDDVITNNKHLSEINSENAEAFMDKSIAKRIITTIATVFATLGAMSVIPKIYAKSDVAPGAKTAMQLKKAQAESDSHNNNTDTTKENVTFKGKNGKNWLSKLGKFIRENQNENISSEFEYDGHNFTNTLFAALSVFGLLLPRGLRAYNRAQKDENGKRDFTEIYEILIRDLTSSLSVIFAVPMLTRAFVTSYEHKSGFVLMNKDRSLTKGKKFIDLINPYSKSHVLSNKELESLYFGVDSKEKMLNFCKYIDKNNGDLQKIFVKSENADSVFNEKTFKLTDIQNLSKKDKNKKIIEFFENTGNASEAEKNEFNEAIKKMMKGAEAKVKSNKMLSFAKGLNSMPALIATFIISPIILGWFIPRITYANTRRIHEKSENQEQMNKVA